MLIEGEGAGRISRAALAAELGVGVTTVYHDALLAGIVTRRVGYSAAQADAIRAVRAGRGRHGSTAVALAVECGIDAGQVARRARRLGIAGAGGFSPDQADAIRAGAQHPLRELAAACGVSLETVRRHARRLGLTGGRYTAAQAAQIRAHLAATPHGGRGRKRPP